jgi:hypothetical protein
MDARGFYQIEITKLATPPSRGVGRNEFGQAEAFRDEGQDGRLTVTLELTCLREADQLDSVRAIEAALQGIGFIQAERTTNDVETAGTTKNQGGACRRRAARLRDAGC